MTAFRAACVLGLLSLLMMPGFPVHASRRSGGIATHVRAYAGLCDVVSGGCAAADSVTHALVAAYHGPLFQVIRGDGKTLNVRQTRARTPDLSGLHSFANGGMIWISKIYDQVNHANDVPVYIGTPKYGPSCTSTLACAAPWWIDPPTGLPLLDNVFPSLFINNGTTVGIDGGSHATSEVFDGRNDRDGESEGITHAVNGEVAGTEFSIVNSLSGGYGCPGVSNQWCFGVDEEEPPSGSRWDGGQYGTAQQDILGIATWDGAAATNTIAGYVNGRLVFAAQPPIQSPFNLGAEIHIGTGGDGGQEATQFRDMAIFNEALTSVQRSAIQANENAFYASASTLATCRGPADAIGYFNPGRVNGSSYSPISRTFGAWGLYQMRASYTGPIADLNNGTKTETFSAAARGCGLDPAAAAFCASGCTVTRLYQQADWNTTMQIGVRPADRQVWKTNTQDPRMSMTVPAGKSAPTVTFHSLNGAPTMHFAGNAELCTGAPVHAFTGAPMTFAAVARRTAGLTTAQVALAGDANAAEAGFAATANRASFALPAMTKAASDGTWHALAVDFTGSAATPYVDGAAGTRAASTSWAISGITCLGGDDNGANLLTGDIAEAEVITDGVLTSSGMGFASPIASLFALQERRWGGL